MFELYIYYFQEIISRNFLDILNLSITASWIILAVLLLRLIFRKAPKWSICLLWLIVWTSLIFPFSIKSSLSVIPSTETVSVNITAKTMPEINSGIDVVDNAVNPVIKDSLSVKETTLPILSKSSSNLVGNILYIASIVWICGIAVMLMYMIISYFRIKRKLRTATLLKENIYQSEFIKSPFVMGMFKPKIYILYSISDEQAEQIIRHEKAHITRLDNLTKPLAFIVLSVYWFNPMIWVAFIFLCKDIEFACDELVIRQMEKEEKQAYARALLDNSISEFSIVACPFSFGGDKIKNRIKNIIKYKSPGVFMISLSVILCISVFCCSIVKADDSSDMQEWGLGYSVMEAESDMVNISMDFEYTRLECVCTEGVLYDWNIGDAAMTSGKRITYSKDHFIRYVAFENRTTKEDAYIYFKAYNGDKLIHKGTIYIKTLYETYRSEQFYEWNMGLGIKNNEDLEIIKISGDELYEVDEFIVREKSDKSNQKHIDDYVIEGLVMDTIEYDIDNDGKKETLTINELVSEYDFAFYINAKSDDKIKYYSGWNEVSSETDERIVGVPIWCNLKFVLKDNKLQVRAVRIKQSDDVEEYYDEDIKFKRKYYDVVLVQDDGEAYIELIYSGYEN